METGRKQEAAIKLICLPYAGGSASSFANIIKRLPQNIHAITFELPGRGKRRDEPLCTDLQRILDDLMVKILSHISGNETKIILWGHSMGALLAFFLTRALKEAGVNNISNLIVSSMKGPSSIKVPSIPLHQLPKLELIARFSSITSSGRGFDVYQNPALIDFIEPVLRADVAAIEKYRYTSAKKLVEVSSMADADYTTSAEENTIQEQLDIPITVIAGNEDTDVMRFYNTWQEETIYPLKSYIVNGGHFFLLKDPLFTAVIIAEIIADTNNTNRI